MVPGSGLAQIIIYLGLYSVSLAEAAFLYFNIMDSNPGLFSGIINSGQIISKTDKPLIANLSAALTIERSFRQDQFGLLARLLPGHFLPIFDNSNYLCALIQVFITGKLQLIFFQETSIEYLFF